MSHISGKLKVVVLGEDTYSYGQYNDKTLLLYSLVRGWEEVIKCTTLNYLQEGTHTHKQKKEKEFVCVCVCVRFKMV